MTHSAGEHLISKRTNAIVFVSLLALLALAIVVAAIDLGRWNLPLALSISAVKTLLIMLFFMHLIFSSALVRVLAVGGLLWLTILMSLTFSDYLTRDWLVDQTRTYHPQTLDQTSEREDEPREQ